ncbi:hypothetical protein [Anaerosporobacter faecicola]|uniref:hypothetical protein n=1 Tax=Anaerosporobacter faecicola TaxID=2718714 RepID=UPI00143B54B3|nr:hypothetical protein [Anaerosporobacter faecicola]
MAYTEQENIKLNNQLKKWQEKQLRAVKRNNIDNAFAKMNDIERLVWEQIAIAETHNEVNYLVWNMAEKIIDKYYKLAR